MITDHAKSKSEYFRVYNLDATRQAPTTALFSHQEEALQKLTKWYSASREERSGCLLVLPTGAGKTHTALRFVCSGPLSDGFKIIWLAHTHHLLDQTNDSVACHLSEICRRNELRVRVAAGGKEYFRVGNVKPSDDVLIVTLQSLCHAARENVESLREFVDSANGNVLVVFDEAHHAPAPSYRKLLEWLWEACPTMMLLGLTATPTHSDEGKKGWLGKLFPQGIIFQETPHRLMAAGVLAKPHIEEPRTNYNVELDERKYQEWIETNRDIPEDIVSQLAKNRERNATIAAHYVEHRDRYGKTIIFADRAPQCEVIVQHLVSRGVRAGAIYSRVEANARTVGERNETRETANSRTLQDFRDGRLDVLLNVKMLTEGTDIPDVQTVFLTRQTTSEIMLTQMVGRALRGRACGGKKDHANIVSFIDNWRDRICWAGFDQIFGDPIDDSPQPYIPRVRQLISMELVRRLARQMDSGLNISPTPYTTLIPLGWWVVEYEAIAGDDADETSPVREFVLVYENEKKPFDSVLDFLTRANLDDFEPIECCIRDVRPTIEQLEKEFFNDTPPRVGLSLRNDLFMLAKHMAHNDGQRPRFFTYSERNNHDLDSVARQVLEQSIPTTAVRAKVREEYLRKDRYWQSLYPTLDRFKSHFDACVNRIEQLAEATVQVTWESPEQPVLEPTEDVKRRIKERDGWICRHCGCDDRRSLQVDHIKSVSHGGTNDESNLQTLCAECNRKKGSASVGDGVTSDSTFIVPKTLPTSSWTLQLLLAKIREVEGFDVRVSQPDGRRVRGDRRINGDYQFQRAQNGGVTVKTWITGRFLPHFGEFDSAEYQVDVLDPDGAPVSPQTTLRKLRERYR